MKTGTQYFLLAAVAAIGAVPVAAQSEAGGAAILGTVSGPNGNTVSAASIVLRNTETGYTRNVVASADGKFSAPVLPVGVYTIEATATGFAKSTVEGLRLGVGEAKTVSVHLQVATVHETVTVSADAASVEPDQTATATSIGSRAIETLPIRGRNFTEFAQLTPGVMQESDRGGLVFAGQRSINSNIAIDGADFNDPLQGNQRGGNQPVFFFPQSAVREFQVVRSGATAEIGRTGAGFVNVVTRSGSNETHGDLYYFHRNKNITSPDAFGRQLDNRQNQFGGSLGGAIRKDKAFYFAAAEQNFLRVPFVVKFQPQAATVVVPSELRALEGEQRGTNNPTAVFVRQDTHLTSRHSLNAAYTYSRMRGENFNFESPQLDAAASANYLYRGDSSALKAGLVSVVSPRLVNELRGQIATDNRLEQPNSTDALVTITGFGTIGGDSGRPREFDSTRYQLADNVSLNAGNHALRFGTDINLTSARQTRASRIQGEYTFTSLAGYVARNINRYRQTLPGFDPRDLAYEGQQREAAFFVNDKWSLPRRVTLNWGVRWEGQWNPQPVKPNPAIPQTARIPNDLNMWQPRLGLAWAVADRTVVRVSAGLLSARTPANLFQRVFTDNGITTVAVDTRTDPALLGLIQFPRPLTALPPNTRIVGAPRVFGFAGDFRNPQSAQVAASIEQAVGRDLTVSIGYVRNSSWHLQRRLDRNLFPPTYNAAGLPVFPTTRPNPAIGVLSVNESSAHSSYDGLLLTATRRFAKRFQVQANYTYAVNYDDDSNERNFSREPTLNPFDLSLERAHSKQDIRHNFNGSGLVQLPLGITLSGIAVVRSGLPYSAIAGTDRQNDANDDNDWATISGRVAGRNTFRQPRFFDLDARLQKSIQLSDRRQIILLAEGFNVTKTANRNFGNDGISVFGLAATPIASFGRPLFAPSTARYGGPRQLQLGARFVF